LTRAVTVSGGAKFWTLWIAPTTELAFASAISIPAEEKLGVRVTPEQAGQLLFEKFNATGPLIVHRVAFRLVSCVKSSESGDARGAGEAPAAAPNEGRANSNRTVSEISGAPAVRLFEPLSREIIKHEARLRALELR